MLGTETGRLPRLILILTLILTPLLPAATEQQDKPKTIADAYQALQAAVDAEDWQAVHDRARGLLAAADQTEPDAINSDHTYMVGMAHYWLMGLSFDAAVDSAGLSPERQESAQAMADMVFQRQSVYVISHGERFEIEDHLAPGKITVFDFYSDFCPPCLAFASMFEALAQQRSDLVLVKVDINRPGRQGIDWHSPVSNQYNLRRIPYMRIYDPAGELTADGEQAIQILINWAEQLERK